MQDINFERWPEFSKNYLLRGRNEEAVRTLFTDDILAYYNQTAGLSTEGNGEWRLAEAAPDQRKALRRA